MIDYKNVLRDVASKEDIINAAVAYARGRVGGAGVITLDVLKEGAFEAVKGFAVATLYPQIDKLLENAVLMFQMTEGERPIGDAPTDAALAGLSSWLDAFDAAMLAALGTDMQRDIGGGAIGEHFTDGDCDDPAIRQTVARELTERLVESAMPMNGVGTVDAKISISKTLSAAGVVLTDLAPYAADGSTATKEVIAPAAIVISEPVARSTVERLVGNYAIARDSAELYDESVLTELLVSAFDTDDFISLGAVERLGGKKEDVAAFHALATYIGGDAACAALKAANLAIMTGEVVAEAKPPKGPIVKVEKPAKGKAGKNTAPPSVPGASPAATPQSPAAGDALINEGDGQDYADVIKIWRTHAKDNDQVIGEALSLSRGTVSNIGLGKSPLTLTPQLKNKVRDILRGKATQLEMAARLLD